MVDQFQGRGGDSAPPDIKTIIDDESPFPPIRRVGIWRPFTWLKLGWSDFRESGGPSVFYGACFAAMGMILNLVLSHAPEYVSALSCGFLLVGPLLALGLYDISRRIENVRSGLLGSVFSMRGRWSNIGVLALVLAVIMMVWARASLVIFALFYNKGMPSMHGFLTQLFSLSNLEFVLVYACIGFVFASIVFAISWVSIPLMLDRDTDAITSMIISCVALFINAPATLMWALLIVASVVIGLMTWNLGFILTMPVIGHATWHAYKEVVGTASDRN
ncbi:DUF2189 domain-containing protein [Undibacterium oligocarboniphilum]|uniref:DUF2189 domain-containing protein n=1 Tax=Undibacterium oligocarboniphilum TaxID=666702 RepID=A0A850QNW2_9BURK|nr:DUF2189 domain-containing protein [Undibacterium oligocarboniphilum]MBC3871568.1 DUF2189 domain-containing protein [Undibacterium oligocarboniphilum]NVO79073.1 DUF2189 domain-containing protein [Undibacterium oligocarboniphilum]